VKLEEGSCEMKLWAAGRIVKQIHLAAVSEHERDFFRKLIRHYEDWFHLRGWPSNRLPTIWKGGVALLEVLKVVPRLYAPDGR
jgi:hypothetical protein